MIKKTRLTELPLHFHLPNKWVENKFQIHFQLPNIKELFVYMSLDMDT